MDFPLISALTSAGRYVRDNPASMITMARHAMGLNVAVPLDAIRWVAANLLTGDAAPKQMAIEAIAPAISIKSMVSVYGTDMRSGVTIEVEDLRCESDQFLVVLRVTDLQLEVVGKPDHPLAKMVASGALDLSKPAGLLGFVPKKPPFVVSAKGDRFELDLMRIPAVAENMPLRMALEAITPVINLRAVETRGDMLLFGLEATPTGLPQTLKMLRSFVPI